MKVHHFSKCLTGSQAWCHSPLILVLGGRDKQISVFKASLFYSSAF